MVHTTLLRARQEPDEPDASPYGPPRPLDPFPQPTRPIGPEPVVRPSPPERPKPPTT